MTIIPYFDNGGQWTLPDAALWELYYAMLNRGAIPLAFCSGGIDDEKDFVRWFKKDTNKVGAMIIENELVALSWVNEFLGRTAKLHYVIKPTHWGKAKSRPILKEFIKYWFDMESNGKRLFDALTGITPASNPLAVKMALDCGGKLMGTIPSQFYDELRGDYVGAVYTMIEPQGVE